MRNKRIIAIIVAVILLASVAFIVIKSKKFNNKLPNVTTNSKSDNKTDKNLMKKSSKISDLVDNNSKGSKNLSDIYDPDVIRNKNFKYNPNVDEMSNDSSALNISSGDLNRLYDHYAAEYLANKYDLTYTLQDIIDWVKIKYKEPEPNSAEDIITSEWVNIQLKGWNETALDSELEYVQELASKKLYDEKSKSMSEDEVRNALETYAPNLRNNGWKDEDKIKAQSIMLYITTNEGISEEYIEDAHTYAELKILKEYLPEKYDEIVNHKNTDEVREKVKNKMTPEGDF